jgi:hypothetical protein
LPAERWQLAGSCSTFAWVEVEQLLIEKYRSQKSMYYAIINNRRAINRSVP